MHSGCSSPCKFKPKKNLTFFIARSIICDWVAKTLVILLFAFKTSSPSFSAQDEFVSIPSVASFHRTVDALSADRFLWMIFNLPPEELDTTMHSPGEYIKEAISTDVRSRTTNWRLASSIAGRHRHLHFATTSAILAKLIRRAAC